MTNAADYLATVIGLGKLFSNGGLQEETKIASVAERLA
jgi:hypothetical protein